MSKKHQQVTWAEWFFWYGTITGVLFTLVAALPPIPWRYAKVDTNVGNRFVTDRRYGMMGCSNNFGQNQMWFALRTKMQRKTEEYGRPSPLTALVGAAGSMVGSGGAAQGCMNWPACKEHVANRYLNYGTVAICGIVGMIMIGMGAMCGLGSLVCVQMEGDGHKKKKKKKSEELEPNTRTMIASIFFFMMPFFGTMAFNFSLDGCLKTFKTQAYYPYAAAYVGFFVACFACFINWVCMLLAINRKYHCCKKKHHKDHGDDMFAGGGGGEWGGDYGGGYGGGGYGGGGGGGWEGGGGGGWEGGGGKGW